MEIVFVSENENKITEAREILLPLGFQPIFCGVTCRETGLTFTENAVLKARAAVGSVKDVPIMADDSGICVDALNGMPGVLSSRWSQDGRNIDLLLWQMRDVPDVHRTAHFVCSIACVMPNTEVRTVSSVWHGRILHVPDGTGGFGYDPVFLPDGYSVSAAGLGSDLKNRISHRYKALRLMSSLLKRTYSSCHA